MKYTATKQAIKYLKPSLLLCIHYTTVLPTLTTSLCWLPLLVVSPEHLYKLARVKSWRRSWWWWRHFSVTLIVSADPGDDSQRDLLPFLLSLLRLLHCAGRAVVVADVWTTLARVHAVNKLDTLSVTVRGPVLITGNSKPELESGQKHKIWFTIQSGQTNRADPILTGVTRYNVPANTPG